MMVKQTPERSGRGGRDERQDRRGGRDRRDRKRKREKSDVDQVLLDVARVTRVVGGGRRFSFRAAVAIGNRKGRAGFGIAKGADVSAAVDKAVNKAKKNMVDVPITHGTIPHDVKVKVGSAEITLRPARLGAGIIAGGALRSLCELAGIKDVVGKMYGTDNIMNNAYAVIEAFRRLEGKRAIYKRRNIIFHERHEGEDGQGNHHSEGQRESNVVENANRPSKTVTKERSIKK